MKRNQVRSVIVHTPDHTPASLLADQVSAFYADIIERKLRQSPLTAKQKISVINKTIENLRLHHANTILH